MRLASLAPSNTEILYALGAGDDVVAVTRFCNYPPEAKAKPRIGGWLDIDYAKLEKLKPDAVLTSTFVQDNVVVELEKRKLQVLHVDPLTLGDVYESIRAIGEAIGKGRKATSVIKAMQKRMKPREKKNIKIYVEEWHKPPTVSGNWVPELIRRAGGISLAPFGVRSYEVSAQAVRAFDPDAMVVTWCGFGKQEAKQLSWIKKRQEWEEIRAIQDGRIHVLDDSLLNRPGPRLADGFKALEELIK